MVRLAEVSPPTSQTGDESVYQGTILRQCSTCSGKAVGSRYKLMHQKLHIDRGPISWYQINHTLKKSVEKINIRDT